MNRATFSDELWIGAKNQSSLVIAGSPRNSFRASLILYFSKGRALNGDCRRNLVVSNQTPNFALKWYRSQTVGAKLHSQKGKSP